MRNVPIASNPGEKVSATLIREILRATRERTPILGPGVKLSTGPNGTVISANAKYSPRAEIKKDMSCFRLDEKDVDVDGEEETHTFLVDCYYNVGGITKFVADIDIEDLIPEESEEDDEEEEEDDEEEDEDEEDEEINTIIYVKIDNSGSVEADSCLRDDLESLQNDPTCYVYPLYGYSSNGELVTDLRTAPQIQQWEVL